MHWRMSGLLVSGEERRRAADEWQLVEDIQAPKSSSRGQEAVLQSYHGRKELAAVRACRAGLVMRVDAPRTKDCLFLTGMTNIKNV